MPLNPETQAQAAYNAIIGSLNSEKTVTETDSETDEEIDVKIKTFIATAKRQELIKAITDEVCKAVTADIVANAEVAGVCPSGGGSLTGGKVA